MRPAGGLYKRPIRTAPDGRLYEDIYKVRAALYHRQGTIPVNCCVHARAAVMYGTAAAGRKAAPLNSADRNRPFCSNHSNNPAQNNKIRIHQVYEVYTYPKSQKLSSSKSEIKI